MIKSKILYGLCIAALGLPFAEAMDRKLPNGMNDNKAIKSPQYGNEQHIKEAKKLVHSNNLMVNMSGNGNGGMFPVYQAAQQNPNQQQWNGFGQRNFNNNLNVTINNNSMTNGSGNAQIKNRKIQELTVSANAELKKLDKLKDCNLFNNIPKMEIQYNGNKHILYPNIAMYAVYLRNVKMLSRENIANVLYLTKGKLFTFWEAALDAIYTRVDADKIWRRDIIDSMWSKLKHKRQFGDFKTKLRGLNVNDGATKVWLSDLIKELEDHSYDVVKNDAYRANNFTGEQIKTIKFLSSTGLKDAEVVEIFNGLFNSGDIFNNNICGVVEREYSSKNEDVHFFYEIDDWLYLTDSDKEKIKNGVLQCETTWEKVAKFLFSVCSFKQEDAIRIVNGTFSKCVGNERTITSDTTANWRLKKPSDPYTDDMKRTVLDLASLGLLNGIGSYIDDTRKDAFKAGFESWIDKMPNGVEKNAFINKLGGYDLGILGECVGEDGMEIEAGHKPKQKRVNDIYEQKEIESYLQTLGLPNEAREEILDIIFRNNFYKIDELTYLDHTKKGNIKNELLKLTIAWQKAARFLHHEELFKFGYHNYLFDYDETTKIVNDVFGAKLEKNWQNVNGEKVKNSSTRKTLKRIKIEDIVLDLAFLGLLKEIGSHIDDNKINEFKDRFKTWIDRMPDEDGEKNAFIEKLGGYKLGILGECVGQKANNNAKDVMEIENINENGIEIEDSETIEEIEIE